MEDNYDEGQRTVWCGNLSDKITEEVLYELFLQAAPLEKVRIPKDKDGKQNSYGFITFKHIVSVKYATDLLNGTTLYDRRINIKPKINNLQRQNSYQNEPTVNTHKQSTQQGNMLDAIQNLNMLLQMGDNLLINNNKGHNMYSQNSYNQNNMHSSSPYRRPENKNYYDDRREDNRSNYRKHHHRNDRHNMNHRSYHGRRYDR